MEFVRKNADLKITKIGLIADKVFGLCNQKPNILDAFDIIYCTPYGYETWVLQFSLTKKLKFLV